MILLFVLLVAQGGEREEAAARQIVEEQGFVVSSIAPLEDRPGWYAFEATREGHACEGTVEVQKKGRKPRGRFAAACEEDDEP